jgi:hypothetical protein
MLMDRVRLGGCETKKAARADSETRHVALTERQEIVDFLFEWTGLLPMCVGMGCLWQYISTYTPKTLLSRGDAQFQSLGSNTSKFW